ncbi:MAG: hypothetical protein ACP5G2_02665 [Candidatus Bipolaricaulaceae bacterium]
MSGFRFPPALINSYHALAILAGLAFLISAVAPVQVGGLRTYGAFLGTPFFLGVTALLIGVLGLHVGGAERHWEGEVPGAARHRVVRLTGLLTVGWALLTPFVVASRLLQGGSWPGLGLAALFLLVCGWWWAAAGLAVAGRLESGGTQFLVKYGGLAFVYFAPLVLAIPVSPIVILSRLWDGPDAVGLGGIALYGGLDLVVVVLWLARKS